MPTPIKVRGLGIKKYNISEYAKLPLYFLGNKGIRLITREYYIIDDLSANALIIIDIFKSEEIAIDLKTDEITIKFYKILKVSIKVTTKGSRTAATVFSQKNTVIKLYTNTIVSISGPRRYLLDLSKDRDLIFEPGKLNRLLIYAYVVNYNISYILV